MPKQRKSCSHRSQTAANLTGPGSSAAGVGPPQMSAQNMTINYTAMPTETLRFMLSQRQLNQTGPRRVLITRLQDSDTPATNTALQVPDQLAAMIASIVEAKLANLNSSSTSEPVVPPEIEPAQASTAQPTLTGTPSLVPVVEPSVVPTLPTARSFNGGQDGGHAALDQGGKRPGGETGSPLLVQCVMRRKTGTSAPSALPVQLMAAKNLLSTNRK